MAFESKDGKKFSMASRRNAHDAGSRVKEKRGMGVDLGQKSPEEVLAPPSDHEDSQGVEEPEGVAAEHGPASEVHITHDHEAGVHSVHSVHPDGHEHHSEHGSAEEAHHHAHKLAGGEHEEEPEPEEDYSDYEEE